MKPRPAQEEAVFIGDITRFQTQLRAYIISLMSGLSGAEDVLQETNIVLWEKRAKFEPGTNFRAWACAIARLEVKAHRRQMYRLGITMLDEELADQLAEPLQSDEETPEEHLQALEQCLARLREPERELIEHRYFSKSTLGAFAARRGQSTETLRNSLYRIRAALRKCIQDKLAISEARL
ncbi:MAG: sigma-70 family RNA polymerase sigma factor [Akkermansiaceae bacterium]|nr:sigma-70 family RNA polymerase sigma factor [Akkermansiaceae bacterium]